MNFNTLLGSLLKPLLNEWGIFNLGRGAQAKARMVTYLPAAHFEVADINFSTGGSNVSAVATSSTGDCLVNCNWFRAVILQKMWAGGGATSGSTINTVGLNSVTHGPLYILEVSSVADFSADVRNVGTVFGRRANVLQTYEVIGVSATDNDVGGGFATNNTTRGNFQPGHRFVRVRVENYGTDSGTFDVMLDAG